MRVTNRILGVAAVASFIGILNVGCERQPTLPTPVGSGDGAMGQGWVFRAHWGGKYRFLLFTDIGRSACDVMETHSSAQIQGGTMKFRGQQHAKDGCTIVFNCTLSTEGNGAVQIDGQSFDLANGAVFLVSTAASPIMVAQLKPAMMPDKPTVIKGPITLETLKSFAQETPGVRKLLGLGNTKDSP